MLDSSEKMESSIEQQEPDTQGTSRICWDTRLFWYLLVPVILLLLIFPGDIQFVNDEPVLILNALDANEKGTLVTQGLNGTVGVAYGAVPSWYYQAFLLLTHNLVVVSFLKNVISIALMVTALIRIARHLDLPKIPILLFISCPLFYSVHRTLWDDGFLVPICLWIFAFAADYSKTKKYMYLCFMAALSVLILYTQIKAFFFCIATAIALVIFYWKEFKEKWKHTAALLTASILGACPYIIKVTQSHAVDEKWLSSRGTILLEFLQLGKILSYWKWFDLSLQEVVANNIFIPSIMIKVLIVITAISIPLCIVGACIAIKDFRYKHPKTTTVSFLSLICFLNFLIYLSYFLLAGKKYLPHYSLGCFVPVLFFYWLAYSRLRIVKFMSAMQALHISSCFIILILMIVQIHANSGSRSIYGTSLKNQIKTVQKLRDYHPSTKVHTGYPLYSRFPHAYLAIQRVLGPWEKKGEIVYTSIGYETPKDPQDARLRLVVSETPFGPFLKENKAQP